MRALENVLRCFAAGRPCSWCPPLLVGLAVPRVTWCCWGPDNRCRRLKTCRAASLHGTHVGHARAKTVRGRAGLPL
ncbi:hypothetical protein NDU88_006308 [Pleurodeles waltl]|uniref:Secreted protein n=1 Tax=Pleurodeles waltl TaxID=8319 RepID=A0AAV7RMP3_PLEWA|nr:hypothetical protein NDU88_006308 [Pleurodeles waltl]